VTNQGASREQRYVPRVFALILLVLSSSPVAGLMGCASSEGEVRAEFQAYVAGANKCTVAAECAVAWADCPLGCFAIVRADRKDDVERKARQLVSDYERGFQSCVYDCRAPGPLACIDQRCGETTL
jgi:hypothetical protein